MLTPAAGDPVLGHGGANKNLLALDTDFTFNMHTDSTACLLCQIARVENSVAKH